MGEYEMLKEICDKIWYNLILTKKEKVLIYNEIDIVVETHIKQ